MGTFIGRHQELSQLHELISSPRPQIAVVYGRRRIGKSALIKKALEGKKALFFEGLEAQSTHHQLHNFCLQLKHQTGKEISAIPKTWREAFLLLEEWLGLNQGCIVLDELQWMANYRHAMISDLKMVWDQYFTKIPHVTLILAGSIASFMLTKVVRSKALYGRTDRVIHLQPFKLKETRQMLPNMGLTECLEAQMIFGGVPKYLELIENASSLYLAMDDLAFSDNGFLGQEFERIFISHFGKNEDFRKIVNTLALHPYGLMRKDLALTAKVDTGGGLTQLLYDLESAGFITGLRSMDRPSSPKVVRYILSDAFVRFRYALMSKQAANPQLASRITFSQIVQKPAFHVWRGHALELLCLNHSQEIAKILGFNGIEYSCGPYFQSGSQQDNGVQIDLAFLRADHVITQCEIKSSLQPIGAKVIEEIQLKTAYLASKFPRHRIQNILIHCGPLTRDVEHTPYIEKRINVLELLG